MTDAEQAQTDRSGPTLLMNPVAAAAYLGGTFSARWLRRAARDGRIPHRRGPRNAVLFTVADLGRLVESTAAGTESVDDPKAPTPRSRARSRRVA
jgi:hypothetical protein